ncbi:MAG: hypothetical protein AB1742_12365 [bacterium]
MKRAPTRIAKPAFRCAAALVVFLAAAGASAPLDYLPVSKIAPGMRGYGLTVFSGASVERFYFKVLGVLPRSGPSGEDLILIQVNGENIESNGGISLGMSGTPVYLGGRLIGAISMNFPEENGCLIGGVTPVESMLKVMKYGAPVGKRKLKDEITVGARVVDEIQYCPPECSGAATGSTLRARLALTPVMINGLDERAYGFLKPYFRNSGLELTPANRLNAGGAAGAPVIGSGADLKPGSSISVQLARGDIDIAAIGTLTAVDGSKFIAFGHPLFRKGRVKYLLGDAHVHGIVLGDVPFKIASTGTLRGTVLEDRGSAVSGVLDRFPELIPISVTVKDADQNTRRDFAVQMVDDRELLPGLILSVLLRAMDNAIDRIGEGTSKVSFSLRADGYNPAIRRENTFYNRYDVAAESLSEIFHAVNFVINNNLHATQLSGLDVSVEINSSASVASIEKAQVLTGETATDSLAGADEQAQPAGSAALSASSFTDGKKDLTEPEDRVPFAVPETGETPEGQTPDEEKPAEDREKTAEIPKVHPGDVVAIEVTLRPNREKSVRETIHVPIPDDIGEGTAVIDIFSGMRARRPAPIILFDLQPEEESPHAQEEEIEDGGEETSGAETFEEMVEDFVSMEKNNELVAVVSSPGAAEHDAETGEKKDEPQKTKKATPWVLRGETSVRVDVRKNRSFKENKIEKSRIGILKEK